MEFIDIKISAQTLNTIGAALQELPYKLSKPAIDEIDRQVREHLARKEQVNDRAKSGEAGNTDGDGNGPDGNYTNQDRQA
jgi:hypothetical protein